MLEPILDRERNLSVSSTTCTRQPAVHSSFKQLEFNSIESAIAALRSGEAIAIVNDRSQHPLSSLICAAQFATPQLINRFVVEARGLLCLAMSPEQVDRLQLPPMVSADPKSDRPAFTVSIDAGPHLGVTTGSSVVDRARTIQAAIDPTSRFSDFSKPGHIFPIRSEAGGVLIKPGQAEAAVDLVRLAGLYPAGVMCEIQNPDGSVASGLDVRKYARDRALKSIRLSDLIQYRVKRDRFMLREAIANLPSEFGQFQIYAYRNHLDNSEAIALVKGNPYKFANKSVLVRIHSECLTGDAFGSLRCDCRPQLLSALHAIEQSEAGVLVYLRQEGRGRGLINKLKAYSLQDLGLDTVEANQQLGFAADLRNFSAGGQILTDLNINSVRLLTNNPRKVLSLKSFGLAVERLPLTIEASESTANYLTKKIEKLGHFLLDLG